MCRDVMCVLLASAGLIEEVSIVESFKVLPGHMDNIVEATQVIVSCLLSEAHTNLPIGHSTTVTASPVSAYGTRVMNPLPVHIELVLVCSFWQLHYCRKVSVATGVKGRKHYPPPQGVPLPCSLGGQRRLLIDSFTPLVTPAVNGECVF